MYIKDFLKDFLTEKELQEVPTAFEIIGNRDKAVAIIEIPENLKKRRKIIAKALIETHKNIKTVLEKKSPRSGVYRVRKYRKILGDKNTEVVHKESGCLFKLDIRKVYFSPRESTERIRISEMVKNKENVMVFFAGIGTLPIIIGKKTGANTTGIEINPYCIKYYKENIRLNKVNSAVIKGDVKKSLAKYMKAAYDRVFMPLPETSIEFIKEAVYCTKKGGIIHIYCFSNEDELKDLKKKVGHNKLRFIGKQKVLPWGPGIYKWRLDFKVL